MRLLGLLPSLTAGCGFVFDLEHVGDPVVEVCEAPVGHDEDGDGLDDACDPCPFSVVNTPDADGDGIANECDPDPGTPNQRLHFDGFANASLAYATTGGGFEAGTYKVEGSMGSGGLLWMSPGPTPDPVWVVAGVDVTATKFPGTYREAALIFDGAVSTTNQHNGTYCSVGIDPDDRPYIDVFVRNRPTSNDMTLSSRYDPSVDPNNLRDGRIIGSSSRTTRTTTCAFVIDGMQATLSGMRMAEPPPGLVGIYAANVDATFAYVFVVGPL